MATDLIALKAKTDWTHIEYFSSVYGTVSKNAVGEWIGRVNLPGEKVGRLAETFFSATIAKGEVERRWKKENGR